MFKKYIFLTIASILYALGVALFFEPADLVTGGVTGIGIILHFLSGVETGTWILLLNIPILIVGTIQFGKRFIASTVYFIVVSSIFTNIFSKISSEGILTDSILIAIAGGGMTAIGMGIAMRCGSTSGGIDIIVKLIRRRRPYLKTSTLILTLDILIVSLGAFAIQNLDKTMYAAISVVTTSYVLDLVLYGRDEARQYIVISDHSEVIAKRLLEELQTGVTYLYGHGAYEDKDKKILLCVVRKARSAKLEEIVKETDAAAFLIVGNATKIYGEGYKSFEGERY